MDELQAKDVTQRALLLYARLLLGDFHALAWAIRTGEIPTGPSFGEFSPEKFHETDSLCKKLEQVLGYQTPLSILNPLVSPRVVQVFCLTHGFSLEDILERRKIKEPYHGHNPSDSAPRNGTSSV